MFDDYSNASKITKSVPEGLLMLVFPLMWVPAFGWLPEFALTWFMMKAGFSLLIFFAFFYEIWKRFNPDRKRALTDLVLKSVPIVITFVIYFVRIVEFLRDEFPFPRNILLGGILLTIFIPWAINNYRSTQEKLISLRDKGLLKKFDILNEEEGSWTHDGLPGLDGSTSEEQTRKNYKNSRWLLLLPISGIVFFLIRTWTGSLTILLFLINTGIFGTILFVLMLAFANIFQLSRWEIELGKPIFLKKR